MTDPLLTSFSGVGFTASGIRILEGIDLALHPGDVLGVTGPNGSGKTTLVRLLAMLIRPTAGSWTTLSANSESTREEIIAARREIGLVGHVPAIWPELTIRENIEIVDALCPGDGEADPLRLVGLSGAADRRAERASLGMQRRVEFARLFRRLPRLLLLDEAHAGLDAMAASVVDEVVRRVTEGGGAAVLVSHEPTRIDGIATRRARIERGTLVEESP